MAKYTFISEDDNGETSEYTSTINYKTGDLEYLGYILYHFQSFLDGCGFVNRDKVLEFVEGDATSNLEPKEWKGKED